MSQCEHLHTADHLIAGMRRSICSDCGGITLSFTGVAALGRTIDDIRREFAETLQPVA